MDKLILRGASIVTMDDRLGDFEVADLVVEGGKIAAIGCALDAAGAEIVDLSGRILIPGLVNAHMHTWQTGLRAAAANWTLPEYMRWMHAGLATGFEPGDIEIATLVGALNQINSGTTTLADWCHNNPTPQHTDAAIKGLSESGIRAVFFHGSPKPEPKPDASHYSQIPHPRAEVERLTARGPRNGGLLTYGLAILGPAYSTLDVVQHDFRLAREFGLIASMHQGGDEEKAPTGWEVLSDAGLLGPWVNVVHGNNLSDGRLHRMAERGVTFSVTPATETTQGHGFPIIGRLRRLGVTPSLGVDIESLSCGDMLSVARSALSIQRALDNAAAVQAQGSLPSTSSITTREALEWVTVGGAKMLGMFDRIGSLTPGKQADIAVIDARHLNMQPVLDLVSSVVTQAELVNIEGVMIAGKWLKRDGRICAGDLADKIRQLDHSGRRILASMSVRLNAN